MAPESNSAPPASMRVRVISDKLVDDTKMENVGTVGGLRVYIPSKIAKDSQFVFTSGQKVKVSVVELTESGQPGILVTPE